MTASLTDAIRERLDVAGIDYRFLEHEPTPTSEDSARARGEPLEVGAKAMLLKVDDSFELFVVSAARKLDSKAIKRERGAKKLRFATPEELLELTGLVPGAVPPFGKPLLPFELAVDVSVFENDRVAFNAGSLRHSIVMGADDYLRAAAPGLISVFSTAP